MTQSNSNLKIISFLGWSNYTEVNYLHPNYNNNQIKVLTPFYQEALVEFYKPKTLYVLLTKKVELTPPKGATESNWQALQKRLAEKVELHPIKNVSEELTPNAIWSIFNLITDFIEPKDRVIFDITNGFRSIPIVALLAISYLRVVRQVEIEALLYGALKYPSQEGEETPSYDLLPIVSLLDWTTATNQFIKTGNGEALADLLKNNQAANETTEKLANNINTISRGLQMLRPMDVMTASAQLPEDIKKATFTISQEIPPFATLLKRVEVDYSKFGLVNPQQKDNAKASLVKQLQMVGWYIEKKEIVQALSIAREWLPSLLCYHFKLDLLEKKDRDEMELLLGGTIKDSKGNTIRKSKYLAQWEVLPEKTRKPLNKLWGGDYNLANLRNDVAHAGYRKNPRDAEKILQQTTEVLKQLIAIAKEWDIVSEEKEILEQLIATIEKIEREMKTRLDQLFTLIQQETKQFKTKYPQGDGRAFWQPMKQLFKESQIKANSWQQLDKNLVDLLLALPEKDETENIIFINHFLRQHVRITSQEEPTLQRIMQIALNSGQFLATDGLIEGLESFNYSQSGLDRLTTYISEDEIHKLSSQIPEKLIEKTQQYLQFE